MNTLILPTHTSIIRVGSIVQLKIALHQVTGLKKGAKGFCYETYIRSTNPKDIGVSIVFQNRFFSDFSPEEQESFLQLIGESDMDYDFKNLTQLLLDTDAGVLQFSTREKS